MKMIAWLVKISLKNKMRRHSY